MFSSFHFKSLDTFLTQHQIFWQFLPFDCLDLPWWKVNPDLCKWLMSTSLSELQDYKEQPLKLAQQLSYYLPELKNYSSLCEIPLAKRKSIHLASRLNTNIPGRKWKQIKALNEVLAIDASNEANWLEWCAGKGYLGRVITASQNAKVTSLEWQSALCANGQEFADKHGLNMHFVQANAFDESSQKWIENASHAVALHACGALHEHLIQKAAKTQIQALYISPCCYHLIQTEQYQTLSHIAKSSALTLSKQCLKLPLQETVTAENRIRKLRYKEVSYRLGFDSLQRSIFNHQCYMPLPNIQKSLLNQCFEDFCHWAIAQKKMTLPRNVNFADFEKMGQKRFELVERIETLRTVFRRPLELWLGLDKVMFLQEMGFDAQLTTFCERALTPRNLLISAKRARI